jgi:hypothetical protein
MAGKTYSHSDVVLNLLRNINASGYATVYMGLLSTAPANDGDPGTELSGSGYSRQAITFSAPVAGSGQSRRIDNNATVEFGPATANWPTVVAAALYTAVTGGTMLYWGNLTASKTVESGDTLRFTAGNATVSED